MKPVKHAGCNFVFQGPSAEIGDLHVIRGEENGQLTITVVYEPHDYERKMIAEGGRVMLRLWSGAMPPISLQAIDSGMCEPVEEHPFKIIPELDDEERQ